jgi:hypothetical protein
MLFDDPISRRQFIRAAGIALSLPFFPSLLPAGEQPEARPEPRRLIFLSTPLGFVPSLTQVDMKNTNFDPSPTDGWFPKEHGSDYPMPEVHADLVPYRDRLSFITGLTNALYRGDTHGADDAFLTCADTMANPAISFTNTVSCDQVAARSPVMHPADVRHASLSFGTKTGNLGPRSRGLSWNEQGLPIMPITTPAEAFDMLFGADQEPAEAKLERLRLRQSILDQGLADLKDLGGRLNAADRRKLDEAVSAVRDLERDLQEERRWAGTPKPSTALARPRDDIADWSVAAHSTAMFDVIHTAFLTDSTRVVAFNLSWNTNDITNRADKHGLNHAQGDHEFEEFHRQLDRHMSRQVAYLLKLLAGSACGDGQPMLHHTLGMFGSPVWGPNHSLRSLPIMLFGSAGGRVKQGTCLACPDPTPLANLWLTMLQSSGIELDRFGDSTGPIREILA